MTITRRLLQRSKAGEAEAAQDLAEAYQQPVYRLALSILKDPAEAEDVAQETLISALSALDSYRGEASFKTWLFSIAYNLCRKRLRRRKSKDLLFHALQTIFRTSDEGRTHPEELVIRCEADRNLWQAVNNLGEKHRLPVVLHYEHGLSVAEIAQVLDLPPGTVLSRLHTARERLRDALSLEQESDQIREAASHEEVE